MVFGTPTTLNAVLVRAGSRRRGCPRRRSRRARRRRARASVCLDPLDAAVDLDRVGPRRAEDRAAARQDAADGSDVERHREALERALPAVAEPDELVPVLLHALAHDGPDDGVEPGAVAAAGQDSDAHARSSMSCGRDPTVSAATVPARPVGAAVSLRGVTFSVVARSPDGDMLGVAVASKFLAVGAAVPAAAAGVGAIATQALANLAYRAGRPRAAARRPVARQATARRARPRPTRGATDRQAGVVDAAGDGATYTGDGCHAVGRRAQRRRATRSRATSSPAPTSSRRWSGPGSQPTTARRCRERLLAALAAGDRAGGDRRGRQSAALLVVTPGGGYGGGSDVLVDLRVDDHPDPVAELRRLLELHRLYFEQARPGRLPPARGRRSPTEVGPLLAASGHAARQRRRGVRWRRGPAWRTSRSGSCPAASTRSCSAHLRGDGGNAA